MNSLAISACKSLAVVKPIASQIVAQNASKMAVSTAPYAAETMQHIFMNRSQRKHHTQSEVRGLPDIRVAPDVKPLPEKELLLYKVNEKFPTVIDNLQTWLKNGGKSNAFEIFDINRTNKGLLPGKETYVGDMCCQMATHLVARELENDKYDIKLFKKDINMYPYNHFYLTASNKDLEEQLIIDPTYRQFLRGDNTPGFENYDKFLFEEKEPFFVGTRKDMADVIQQLYEKQPIPFIDISTRNVIWDKENAQDVTFQLKKLKPIMEKYIVKK